MSKKVFGDQAEYFFKATTGFERIETGSNLPDFIYRGSDIPLLIETKTGINKKGSVNAYQLSYTSFALEKIAGWSRDKVLLFIEQNYNGGGELVAMSRQDVAVYYNLILRNKTVSEEDTLKRPKKILEITFEDQFIIPYEYVFYHFINQFSSRYHIGFESVREDMIKIIKNNITTQKSNAEELNETSAGWQNLHATDLITLYNGEAPRKNHQTEKRIQMIKTQYPVIDDLLKFKILGPNNTNIHIFCYPEHENVFRYGLQNSIKKNIASIEDIQRQRIELANIKRHNKDEQELKKALLQWKNQSPLDNEDDKVPF